MTSVDWLSDSQQRIWRNYIRVNGLVGEHLAAALEHPSCQGMNIAEYELLVRLSEAPDLTVRMSDLANDLVYSRSRTTHAVRRLESRGWVLRRPCENDGRGIECVLTGEGLRAIQRAAPVHVNSVREVVVDVLTDAEFRALGEIMAVMCERIEASREGR